MSANISAHQEARRHRVEREIKKIGLPIKREERFDYKNITLMHFSCGKFHYYRMDNIKKFKSTYLTRLQYEFQKNRILRNTK
jgi:16S rRNA U516 pseudouridylate synthase RsuA-like enzyme